MGLLDALFDPASYGGSGGLLDLIRQQQSYQPGQGFGDPPVSPQDRMAAMPGMPPAFQPAPQSINAANYDPQTFAPNQASPIAVGSNYQMPRIGAAPMFASGAAPGAAPPDPAALPPAAAPTQGQLPPGPPMPQAPAAPLPPAFGTPSFGGNIGASLQSFANTPGGLVQKLLGGTSALMSGERTDPTGIQQQNLRAQYEATRQVLQQSGLSPQEASSKAMLAVLNPEAGKTILPEALTSKTEIKMVKDALGAEHPYSWNAREQTFKPVNADGEGSGGGSGPGMSMLAPGVKQYNPSLSGQDYLNQFGPEVQAAAKAYMNGDVMPTGNPRAQGIATLAKTVAQKVGMDTGNPVSDTTYAAKRKMHTDLASSSNSTMGGILSNGESSFKHLAEYTASVADQGNASHNFPGGGQLAHAQNYVGNTFGGSDTLGKVKAINDNLGKYGAESTKFYAGTGGGVEERLNALKEMNGVSTSGEEAAAYAAKEKNLMLDRLNTKFQEIKNTLGEERGNAEIAKHMPDIQKNIATIDANIAKLRGNAAPGTPAAAAPPALPSGWSVKVH